MCAYINLTKGKVAIVDDADFAYLNQFRWHAACEGKYAARRLPNYGKIIYMHRFILGGDGDKEIDHMDRNGLNNSRANLRLADRSQNACNTRNRKSKTGLRGVHKDGNQFVAELSFQKKKYRVGRFATAIEAAKARDEMAKKIHQEFANLNGV